MLTFPSSVRIYVALQPVDMRKSHHALAAIVREHLKLDPLAGHLVFFVNKRRNLAKVLFFDQVRACHFVQAFGAWHLRASQGRTRAHAGRGGPGIVSDDP